MNRLANEQRLQIIEFYYQNACSVKKVHRSLLPFYGQFTRLTEAAIRAIVTKFRTKFTLLDIKQPTRLRRVRKYRNAEFLVNGLLESWPKILFFIYLSINCVERMFGVMIRQKNYKTYECIQKTHSLVRFMGW